MTQGFFTHLLENRDLETVAKDRGRFRSFLLVAMRHFMLNEWERQRAQKRDGLHHHVSIDVDGAESRLDLHQSEQETPEAAFDREWALTLLDQVHAYVRRGYEADVKADLYDELEPYLTTQRQEDGYQELAGRLETTEAAVKTAVHRLRKKFRKQLRAEIAQTVNNEEEIEDELRELFAALKG